MKIKCPKCGGDHVQFTPQSKHGCLWLVLFGWLYVLWLLIKYVIGAVILVCFDWWLAIVYEKKGRLYIWKSHKWFRGKKFYYCHDCGNNFCV